MATGDTGDPQVLVAQLLEAATCPVGEPLPAGTLEAAWQLCEVMVSIIALRDVEAQRTRLERTTVAMAPLIEATMV